MPKKSLDQHIGELANLFTNAANDNKISAKIVHDALIFTKSLVKKKPQPQDIEQISELLLLLMIILIQSNDSEKLCDLLSSINHDDIDGISIYYDACFKLYDNGMGQLLVELSTNMSKAGGFYIITLYYCLLFHMPLMVKDNIEQIMQMALMIRRLMEQMELPECFGTNPLLRAMLLQLLMVLSSDEMRFYLQDDGVMDSFTNPNMFDVDGLDPTTTLIITAAPYDNISLLEERFLPSLQDMASRDDNHPSHILIALNYNNTDEINHDHLLALQHDLQQTYPNLHIAFMPLVAIIIQESTLHGARFFAAREIMMRQSMNLLLLDGMMRIQDSLSPLCELPNDKEMGVFTQDIPLGLCFYYQADIIYLSGSNGQTACQDFLKTFCRFVDFYAANEDRDTKMVHRGALWGVLGYLMQLGTEPLLYDYRVDDQDILGKYIAF